MSMKQQTLQQAFELTGKGLHTGVMIHVRVVPSEENTGIQICRTDLAGAPCFRADVKYVTATSRGTVLENGAWKVSTVEHMMAAFYAMGLTNCKVETDAPEVPILDGSAMPWVNAIRQVGLKEQEAQVKEWVITEPITLDNGKGSTLTILPAEQYQVEVHVDYGSPILGKQTAVLEDLTQFTDEIATARTFCFLREIKPLLQMGLIKGGDMQNALVIYDKKIWQWTMNRLADKLGQPRRDAKDLGYLSPLKFENEPARHKLLDVVGDMALLGCYIRGKLIATKPGHGFNTWCGKQLAQQ